MRQRPALSLVVPLKDEEENLPPLVASIRSAMKDIVDWELILVDDGSRDRTPDLCANLAADDVRIIALRLHENHGQTAALQAGFDLASGDVVITMDGDLQNDPHDIPALLAKLDEGYDLVSGIRDQRQDPFLTRRLPSLIANRLIRLVTGIPIRDIGCTLKAYRRAVLDRMFLYSDMHRFIPVLAASIAGARITDLPVQHHPRRHGTSKYGFSRALLVLSDLLVLLLIRNFRTHPITLFVGAAIVSFGLATIFGAGALWHWFSIATGPSLVLPAVTLLWVGLGAHLIVLGLAAEMVSAQLSESDRTHPIVHERVV